MSSMKTPAATVAGAALLLLFVSLPAGVTAQWSTGRATYYGNEPWGWSIHYGSCGYYYQWPDQGTGWDVAGISDRHPDFRGSCGGCYEVKCKSNSSFADGYGQVLDRKSSCYDSSKSVIVKVTDSCPCSYPNNYYSNKRWCCGDMDHFDISVWAFEKLADLKWGVISVQYRRVACDAKPEKTATTTNPFPGEFPPLKYADWKPAEYYYKWFPKGGFLNTKQGDGSGRISVDEYLARAKAYKEGRPWTGNSNNNNNNRNNNGGRTSQENAPKPAPKPAAPKPAPAAPRPAPAAPRPAPAAVPAPRPQAGSQNWNPFNFFGLFGR